MVGDLIRLKSGDKVPADCRVILNMSMRVDQAMITGESEAVDTTVIAADRNPLEARNLIFNGSLVVDGGCIAVVVRAGDDTLIGSMVGLTGDVGKESSRLKKDVDYFVKVITVFAVCQGLIIFAICLGRGQPPITAFTNGFIGKPPHPSPPFQVLTPSIREGPLDQYLDTHPAPPHPLPLSFV